MASSRPKWKSSRGRQTLFETKRKNSEFVVTMGGQHKVKPDENTSGRVGNGDYIDRIKEKKTNSEFFQAKGGFKKKKNEVPPVFQWLKNKISKLREEDQEEELQKQTLNERMERLRRIQKKMGTDTASLGGSLSVYANEGSISDSRSIGSKTSRSKNGRNNELSDFGSEYSAHDEEATDVVVVEERHRGNDNVDVEEDDDLKHQDDNGIFDDDKSMLTNFTEESIQIYSNIQTNPNRKSGHQSSKSKSSSSGKSKGNTSSNDKNKNDEDEVKPQSMNLKKTSKKRSKEMKKKSKGKSLKKSRKNPFATIARTLVNPLRKRSGKLGRESIRRSKFIFKYEDADSMEEDDDGQYV